MSNPFEEEDETPDLPATPGEFDESFPFGDADNYQPGYVRRSARMRQLRDAPWNLETLLAVAQGLMDRSQDVRIAAFDSLMEIARKDAAPIHVTPLALLRSFMFDFTVSSGVVPATFHYLLKLKTHESRRMVKDLLDSPHMRNEDFKILVQAVVAAKDPELRAFLDALQMPSANKAKVVRAALRNLPP